jgi:hypothetical protein
LFEEFDVYTKVGGAGMGASLENNALLRVIMP